MSAPGPAVFLSYASQDAAAAKRICDALRAAGVEVWFDQSELVGGDAWDAKIRRQIGECALFVPIISANSQARREGYFRIEWRLAAQRTHAMADGTPFLLPVVVDETRDAAALVPVEFKAVQWTRLADGAPATDFARRVARLLADDSSSGPALAPAAPAPRPASPPARGRPVILAAGLLLAVGATAVGIWKLRTRPEPPAAATATAAVTVTAATPLVAKARELLDGDPLMTRANVVLAEQLAREAVAAVPDDAEAHAVLAWANFLFISENYDDTPARRADLRDHAEKARLLAPDSPNAEMALCGHLLVADSNAEALVRLRALAARVPGNLPVLRFAAWADLWRQRQSWGTGADRDPETVEKLRATSVQGAAYADTFAAARHWVRGEYREADALLDRVFAGGHPVRTSYLVRLLVLVYGWGDLPAARAFAETIPSKLLLEDVFIAHVSYTWLLSGEHDKALAVLERTPREMLQEARVSDPTAMLRGDVLAAAGRPAAAAVQWREALRVVEQRLAAKPADAGLLDIKAKLLASLGDRDGAAATFALEQEIAHPAAGSIAWAGSFEYFSRRGDVDATLARVDRLVARDNGRWPGVYNALRHDPLLAAVRADPRAQPILERGTRWLEEMKAGRPAVADAPADDKSVAVLAFANLSDDKANEYFSDGISEELLNVLAKVPGLKVSARTSAFFFKGKEVPVPEIARQLGVAYIVEGSVRKAGDKVRITAQLIKAADGFHVWSDTFTRDLKDIFAVQDEIAGLIAQSLELKIGVAAARPVVDLEAYQEYLAGLAAYARAEMAGLHEATAHFARAVAIDANFAAGWVKLAQARTQLGRWGGEPTVQAWTEARAAIDQARRLEPDSPDVLLALGWIRRTAEWDWRGAEAAYRRALQLRPDHADTLAAAAVLLFNLGRNDEAFRLGRQAVQLDPLNAATLIDLSLMYYFNGNSAESEKLARRALQLAPNGASYHSILAWSLLQQGRLAEAEAEAARDTDRVEVPLTQGLVAMARGQRDVARARLDELEAVARRDGNLADLQNAIAWLSVSLGDPDRAFAALERARDSRDPSMSWLRNTPYLAPLFSDPRWARLLHQVGLADDQLR